MLSLLPATKELSILCFGAHSDDIEIGCGGSLLKLLALYDVSITWVVLSATEQRKQEALNSAETLLKQAKKKQILVADFKENYFPYIAKDLKPYIETFSALSPDLIFTHAQMDKHQDHQMIAKLCWNTFRNHLILEYEIPKFDGDLKNPNVFIPLEQSLVETKLDHLMNHFHSQQEKPWYDRETFSGLMRIRGVESQSPSRFAEAFYGHKLCLT